MTDEAVQTVNDTEKLERQLGLRLADGAGASRTLEAIRDSGSCYADIFRTAAEEIGPDALVKRILSSEQLIWARHALTFLPDLDEAHKQALAAMASRNVGTASALGLNLAPGAAFEAAFTMFWQNPPDTHVLPNAANPDSNAWKWSIRLSISINRSWTIQIPDFAIEGAPVNTGATCWLVSKVVAGPQTELTNYSFTYDAGGPARMFNTWGVVNSPKFCLQDYPASGQCT